MAWTTPKTWTANELVTHTLLNQQLPDNLLFLKSPPGNNVVLSSDFSTSSTSFVDVTSATVSFTTAGGSIFAIFAGIVSASAAAGVLLRFMFDSTPSGTLVHQITSAANYQSVAMIRRVSGLSAGSHTVKVQMAVTTSTGTLSNSVANGNLYAGEIT